jgi:hypothetical protein
MFYKKKGICMQDFNIKILTENMLEEEKRKFGGKAYEQSYRLPIIKLSTDKNNKYNIYSFELILKSLSLMFETSGTNITIMFADLSEIYNMEEELNKENPIIIFMRETIVMTLGQLALAGNQTDNLLIKLKDSKDKIEIEGQEYCFIMIALSCMVNYYTYIFQCITTKKYISKKFIDDMYHTLSTFISEEFEYFRQYFNVIECMDELKETRILH